MNGFIKKLKNGYDGLNRRYKRGYNSIFFSCEQMMILSSTSMDKKLSLRERVVRRLHFFLCSWCRRYEKQLRFLRANVAQYAEGIAEHGTEELSSGAQSRIRKRLHEKNDETL